LRAIIRKYSSWAMEPTAAATKGVFEELDDWVRRVRENILWRRWKHPKKRRWQFMRLGHAQESASMSAVNCGGTAGQPHELGAAPEILRSPKSVELAGNSPLS
jgi:hypothetical protein